MSKILVTGGSGFVGSYILRHLIRKGYTGVSATIRKNSDISLIKDIEDKVTLIEADVTDTMALENAIKGMDVVIHTAAVVSFKAKDRDKMMKINIEGTANVVNISIDENIKKLIHISSIAALGRKESGKLINEDVSWQTSKTNSDYAISKYLSEMEVWRGHAEGLPMAILNPSLIIGAGFWHRGTGELFSRVYKGLKYYTTGTNGFVDVRDVEKMTVALMESDINGQRFICNSENMKLYDFFSKIALVFGKKPPQIKVSGLSLKIISQILNIISFLPGYDSNITAQSLRNAAFDSLYDNTKSKENIPDFDYIPIDKTVKDTCEAFVKSKEDKKEYGLFL